MVPHIGAGACEAIEVFISFSLSGCPPVLSLSHPTQDGYVLAQILAYAQKKGPLEALSDETMALCNRLRPPIANFVHDRARLQGLFYEFNEEGADLSLVEAGSPVYSAKERLAKLGEGMQDGYLWWKHSIVRETDAAVKRALGEA